jgi:DNA polymerase III epsilon subunit-like protein
MKNDKSKIVVAIDTETTGLGYRAYPPRDDAIVQVGVAWRDATGKITTWGSLCFPGKEYFANGRAHEALKINGLSVKQIFSAEKDVLVASKLKRKIEEIGRAHKKETEFRAYHNNFDRPFLEKKPWEISPKLWGPCIMKATGEYLGLDRVNLGNALTNLGLEKPKGKLHNAEVDAHSALLIYEKISGVKQLS